MGGHSADAHTGTRSLWGGRDKGSMNPTGVPTSPKHPEEVSVLLPASSANPLPRPAIMILTDPDPDPP